MIDLITPFFRISNYYTIYSNLRNNFGSEFRWYLIYKPQPPINAWIDHLAPTDKEQVSFHQLDYSTPWGHEQRNFYIEQFAMLNNSWCYFLDDDNITSPDLAEVYNLYKYKNQYKLIVFSQKAGYTDATRLFAEPGCLTLGRCDIGSFLIKGSLLSRTRLYFFDQRNCDGHMAEDLDRITDQDKILYIPNKFTYYNALSNEIF